jgi:hypothetical protein
MALESPDGTLCRLLRLPPVDEIRALRGQLSALPG